METLKRIFKVVYTVLFSIFMLVAFFITLTSLRLINGYNFYVVMSGSMEPAIKTGSIVGVKEEGEYKIDDVITVKMENDPSQTYTHRVIEVRDDSYRTKGDANDTPDGDPASKENVVGKVFASIPYIGYAVNFAKQPTGFILMVIVPTIVIVASEINNVKETITETVKKKQLNSKEEKNEEK